MHLQLKTVTCWFIVFLALAPVLNAKRRDKYGMLRPPPLINSNEKEISDEWFTQTLDHFNPTDNRTFEQRYYSSDAYAKTNGPVFLWLGGEGEASSFWMTQGAWVTYAETYGAFCFIIEHRFYGNTKPTSDLSVDNLKYLSSEQALADIAYFIEGMHKKYNFIEGTKWIVFGGSYAGNLAAWVRFKYPHLVHGSVSSSGPLLAKVDFKEYFDVVTNSLATYGMNCVNNMKNAMQQVKKMLKTTAGRKTLYKKFKLCKTLNKNRKEDVASFLEIVAGNIAVVVQYNDYSSLLNINNVCNVMTNKTIGNNFKRFVALENMFITGDCLDYEYKNKINSLINTSWEIADGGRQWTYQTCTEFGYYQTSNKKEDLFGDSFEVDFFIKQCTDVFGNQFNKNTLKNAVQRSNIIYGGLNTEESRVVYVQGSIDPWHALGIIKTNSTSAPAIYINGTSHCANMYYPSSTDPVQLVEARKQISSLIGQWLEE